MSCVDRCYFFGIYGTVPVSAETSIGKCTGNSHGDLVNSRSLYPTLLKYGKRCIILVKGVLSIRKIKYV